MAYVNKHENIMLDNNIVMSSYLPKEIRISSNLSISKGAKKKIKKEYGLNFRGKSKKQQKDLIMKLARETRGTRRFKNEKYAWRYMAQVYNTTVRGIIKRKRKERKALAKRFSISVTIRWRGYRMEKGHRIFVGEGQRTYATGRIREKDIAKWIKMRRNELEEEIRSSPIPIVETEVIDTQKVALVGKDKYKKLTERLMKYVGVMNLDNMIGNEIWCKNRNMCVVDFIQYRYGKRKGFIKLTTDDAIEYWATHVEIDGYTGNYIDEQLQEMGNEYMEPNKNGYCSDHIKNWCKKAKVNMYALVDNEIVDYYYTEDARKKRNPPLLFEMKNSHLYPIVETKRIKSITNKPKEQIIKSIQSNSQQQAKEKEEANDDDYEIVFMDIKLWNSLPDDKRTYINYAMEIMGRENKMTFGKTKLRLFQKTLHSFKLGNKKYLMKPPPLTNKEIQLDLVSKTAIIKDKNLKAVMDYCKDTNINYTGQQPQYFTKKLFNKFKKTFSSYFSVDVEKALSTTGVKNRVHQGKYHKFNWAAGEIDWEKGVWRENAISYDINKCYRSVMENPMEEFMVCGFNDTIRKVDNKYPKMKNGKYPIGLYYVKTSDSLLFHYDNWYSSAMLNYAAVEDIQFEVKYYITAKGMPNPFINMIEQIKEDFNKYPQMMKLIINSIWGYLMKTKSSATILHVDEDIRRIYDTHITLKGKKNENLMFNKYDNCGEKKKTLYTYGEQQHTNIKNNCLPMGIQITDQANIRLYKLMKLMSNDLVYKPLLLHRNTDCITMGYNTDEDMNTIQKRIKVDQEVGGYSINEFPENGWEVYYPQKSYEDRRVHFKKKIKYTKWNDLEYNDSDDWLDIVSEMVEDGGGMLLGRAGTGKSYVCIQGMKSLKKDCKVRCDALAFTNKATIQLSGKTIHNFLRVDQNGKLNIEWARKKAKAIDVLFIDEISMIAQDLWSLLAEFKYYSGCTFILIGDYRQLPPVCMSDGQHMGSWENYFNHPTIKWLANYNRCELNQMKRYDIRLWNLLEDIWEERNYEGTRHFFNQKMRNTIEQLATSTNITYKNETRRIINKRVQEYLKPDDAIEFKIGKGDNKTYNQNTYIFKGAKLIMYCTPKDKIFKKNETVIVKDLSDTNITITNGNIEATYPLYGKSGNCLFHKMFLAGYATTIHKSQGDTVEGDVNIFDTDFLLSGWLGHNSSKKAIYTALSRAKNIDNIKISML